MGFLTTFSTFPFTEFQTQNRAPLEDMEASDLKFCMKPSFIITHAGKKVENDPREKLQFRTV